MQMRDPHTNPPVANPQVKIQGLNYERNPGAEFGDHIKNTAAICNSAASHTYGNVMSIVENYLLDRFPKDLFKTVTMGTTLASRQVSHLPSQLHKKELPLMVLIPRIVFGQDDNRFLAHTLINSRVTNTFPIWGEGSLIPLAVDQRKRVWVHGHFNRAVMYIDVVLSFMSYQEQVNWLSYLHNMIPIGHNFFIRAPLELYIPNEFTELISGLVKIPRKDENGSVHKFLSYLNGMWSHPITYKLRGATNTDEFFMYYIADIDTVIQDIQHNTGQKDGQIRRNFDISFTVRCEFNTIGYFMLNSPEVKEDTHIIPVENEAIVPIFSDVIHLDDFQLPIGWKILSWPIFKLKDGEGEIDITPILNQSLSVTIDHHISIGIPIERFLKIEFRENGQILDNESYFIDWINRKLKLTNPNHRRTYRLLVTCSDEYVNNFIKETYNLE